MHNVESCLKADLIKGSQIVIASHNQETLEDIKALDKKYTNPAVQVEYAQLLGLADHLTIQLKQQGYPVYKYLPYGPTSTMVPYLIRRAQELSQMKYPLKLQYDLIIDEFKQRMGLTS
jgi:proline dehydrogenase